MVDLERRDDVFVLHWRDGENRFNRHTVDALNRALDEVEASVSPCALVTTGEGKFYSNGLDLDWMMNAGDAAAGFVDEVHDLLARVLTFPTVTVAAINGHAFAAGAMFATAHDFKVMRDDRGYWCLPEVDLGLPLTPAMHAVITAKLSKATAHESLITGQRYSADEAQVAGIVHLTASEDKVVDRAVGLAQALAAKDRSVIARHKQLLYADAVAVVAARH